MGTRRGGGSGGVGKSQSNSDRILRRHIEAAGKSYSTVEELVDHLRSSYPHYSRHKVRPFTKHVERLIMVSSSRINVMEDSNDDGDTPTVKKRKKVDGKEEKLQLIEAEHVRRRNVSNNSGGGSSSSLASVNSSEGGDSSEEEASTSDDAVYGEKFEPEFDLMKSMMREGLRRKSKKLEEQSATKEAVELEMDNESSKELNLMNERPKLGCNLNKLDMNGNLNKIDMNVRSQMDGNESNRPMFKDLGGMRGVIEELKMDMIVNLYNPQIPRELGANPVAVTGILLHGPPGCGKTMLAHAIANETGVPFYKISATELVSGVSGASEENIRELFSKAYRTAPSILFIDEIDAIASKRENSQRGLEQRIVTQLMTCMSSSESSGHVLVIGATNRPDALDPALRRSGRFGREIVLGAPDEDARVEILSALTTNLKVEGAFDLLKIARATPGFVGADLSALVDKTTILTMQRKIGLRKDELIAEHGEEWWKQRWSNEYTKHLYITMADFEEAIKLVQPSLKREGFSSIPNVKWDDVGGLHSLRQEFERSIVRQIKSPEKYENFGVALKTGFLLYGPPGCGKTLIAKAVANEAGANFIHIKGPELLNKYVGESELSVRTLFSRARTCSPCVLFFDEVDALTTERGKEGGGVVDRLVAQILIELDGAEDRRDVYVIGATNRPEAIDQAMLRRGRFGMLMYVPLPSPDERGLIMKALAKNKPVDPSVDLIALGKDCRCDNLSGADLDALMNEAALVAVEDSCNATLTIKDEHFTSALKKISPSVSEKQRLYYKLLSERLKAK